MVPNVAPLLAYASADPAALRPGERLLWEGGVRLPRRRFRRALTVPAFRITDRRAFCTAGRPNVDQHRGSRSLARRPTVVVRQPRRGPATIELGAGLWLTGLDDWRTPALQLAALPPPPRRRRRSSTPPEPRMPPTSPEPAPVDPDGVDPHDLALLADERVVWSGRATPWSPFAWPAVRHKLVILAWAAVPTAALAWAVHVGPHETPAVVVGAAAIAWLATAAHWLTVAPFRRRRQLARSRYVLTTRRAFAVAPAGGGRRVAFVFLDALPATFARQHWPDGYGDVPVEGPVVFERVADPAAVHAQLVEAVLAARRDLPDLGWGSAYAPDPDD